MAQQLMNQQLRTRWPAALKRITARVRQSHRKLFGDRKIELLLVSGRNRMGDRDAKQLQTILRGEFTIAGFRNRDHREHLFAQSSADDKQARSQAAKVTRMIRMLSAHGLVQKVSKTLRYVVTNRGAEIITALNAARNTNIKTLISLAA
jgi:hypothetical protein